MLTRQLRGLNSRKESLDRKVQELSDGKVTLEKRISEMESMLSDKVFQIDSLKDKFAGVQAGRSGVALEKERESAVELPGIVVHSSPSSGVSQAQMSAVGGKILAINTESSFVVIDLGTSAGVKVGDEFDVYRGEKSIGSIVVIQARENISACDIKRTSTALKVGDIIR